MERTKKTGISDTRNQVPIYMWRIKFILNSDALRDLVSFVQFKKR